MLKRQFLCRSQRCLGIKNISTSSTGVLDELRARGFIQDITREDKLRNAMSHKKQVVYLGIDPSAGSLHAGHLFPFLCLLHFHLHGHNIVPLIGGATGLVGDPSGRATERERANPEKVERNVEQLTHSVKDFFKKAFSYASRRFRYEPSQGQQDVKVLSNLDWHKGMGLLEFLQVVGVHVRVNSMLNRESVQTRMASQQGISYTEFTYQLLQGYDFYHLNKNHDCTIQLGGSDQWGNIVAGIELINKLNGITDPDASQKGFGITTPLLTTASGEKFGKSAGNAVWLDPQLTSPFEFYQFFLRTSDADVGRYLRIFTLLPLETIEEVMNGIQKTHPEKREAQRLLANEVTDMIHGPEGVSFARAATKCLFESDYTGLRAVNVISALQNDSRLVTLSSDEMFLTSIAKLAATHGLVNSASAARTLIQSKGLYVNNRPVVDVHAKLDSSSNVIDGRLVILRAGKDKHLVLALA